jgi:hypothetical protein
VVRGSARARNGWSAGSTYLTSFKSSARLCAFLASLFRCRWRSTAA